MPSPAQKQDQPKEPESAGPIRSNTPSLEPDRAEHPVHHLQRNVGNQALQRMLRVQPGLPILQMQRNMGNQAVQRMLQTRSESCEQAHEQGGEEMLADRLPHARGSAAEQAIVEPASPLADRDGTNAVTLGQVVHLSPGLSRLETAEQQRVLAHEAVHVAQHEAPGPSASRDTLEMEARQLTPLVLSGHGLEPQFHADAAMPLADDGGPLPNDTAAVAKAKARREVLLRFKERKEILERRQRLDDTMKELLQPGQTVEQDYREWEREVIATLNKKPVTLEMTAKTVTIRARFQVRFEGLTGKEAEKSFPTLKKNFEDGVRQTWNQELKGTVLPGRTFELIPDLKLISSTAARDKSFWLITVRPTDKGPMLYGKTSLGNEPVPTAATDPGIDGGVMSLPPIAINQPDVLGHETLHLFGMRDRYLTYTAESGKQVAMPMRDTERRPDPLGEAKGKILEEDLGFVLDQFGVYPTMSESEVAIELKQVDEIIRTGRDPYSLIRKRKDFTPEMIKQAEDLD